MKLFYHILPLIAGAGITIQVGLNTKLRLEVGSPILASLISFLVGSAGLSLILLYNVLSGAEALPALKTIKDAPWWVFMGGLFGALYVFTTIITSPRIGFANMFSLVIAGQIFLAVIVDHFGILGNIHTINPIRIIGIILLMLGAYIIQTH